jgi:Na+-transporting NADH:ubiquinone oxidoreductase subunit B
MVKNQQPPVKILLKQAIMSRVLVALLPCVAGSIYFFGWRSLFMVALAALTGFIAEFIFTRQRQEPVTEAVFVTTTIFTLIMPPTVPWHVLIIGVIFAVMIAKEIFGGFGRNFFNPAMAGRCFVYICFPVALTATWAPVAQGRWGALDKWTTVSEVNVITSATPMADLKADKLILGSQNLSDEDKKSINAGEKISVDGKTFYKRLLFGRISGTVGVTSALLILIGGIYLYVTKTASRAIILSLTITYAVLNQTLYMFNVEPVNDAIAALLGGGFLFGAFFMATDPISAPRTQQAKIIYGVIIAVCTVVIRNFSIFNGGLMFSILIGNMFAPLLDKIVKTYKDGRKTVVTEEKS